MTADLESKTAVADEAMKKLEATDAEIQDKSDQIEANQSEIEPLKQEFIETEAAAGAESDKDAKIAELEPAVNAKNEEFEGKNMSSDLYKLLHKVLKISYLYDIGYIKTKHL